MYRWYIQPQWVFDCVNRRRLLPIDDYSPGASLPPHLSPFTEEGVGDYVPPERVRAIAQDEERMPDEISESEEEQTEDNGEWNIRIIIISILVINVCNLTVLFFIIYPPVV